MSSSPASAKAADSFGRPDESRMTGVAPSEFASIPRGWSPLLRVQQDGLLVFDRLPELERGLILGSSLHTQHPPSLAHIRTAAPVDFDTLYCLLELANIPPRPSDASDSATAHQLLSFLQQLGIMNAVDWIVRPVGSLGDHTVLVYLRDRVNPVVLMNACRQKIVAHRLGWVLQFWTCAELGRLNSFATSGNERICARVNVLRGGGGMCKLGCTQRPCMNSHNVDDLQRLLQRAVNASSRTIAAPSTATATAASAGASSPSSSGVAFMADASAAEGMCSSALAAASATTATTASSAIARSAAAVWRSSIRVVQQSGLLAGLQFDFLVQLERGLMWPSSVSAAAAVSQMPLRLVDIPAGVHQSNELQRRLELQHIPPRPLDQSEKSQVADLIGLLHAMDLMNSVDWIARPAGLLDDDAAIVQLREGVDVRALVASSEQRTARLLHWTSAELRRLSRLARRHEQLRDRIECDDRGLWIFNCDWEHCKLKHSFELVRELLRRTAVNEREEHTRPVNEVVPALRPPPGQRLAVLDEFGRACEARSSSRDQSHRDRSPPRFSPRHRRSRSRSPKRGRGRNRSASHSRGRSRSSKRKHSRKGEREDRRSYSRSRSRSRERDYHRKRTSREGSRSRKRNRRKKESRSSESSRSRDSSRSSSVLILDQLPALQKRRGDSHSHDLQPMTVAEATRMEVDSQSMDPQSSVPPHAHELADQQRSGNWKRKRRLH